MAEDIIGGVDTGAPAGIRERILAHHKGQRDAELAFATPGSAAASEYQRAGDQEGFGESFTRGFEATAAYGVYRYARDEWGQPDDPEFRPTQHYDELTKDIPVEYHSSVLSAGSLDSANRMRKRIQDDLENMRVLNNNGTRGTLAMIAGGMIDVDLPLMFLTDGAYMAAKVARATRIAGNIRGMSPQLMARLNNTASGVISGGVAGATVGAVDASVRETTDWTAVASFALGGVMIGGAIGAVSPTKRALRTIAQQEQVLFHKRMAEDPDLGVVPTGAEPVVDPVAAGMATRREARVVVMEDGEAAGPSAAREEFGVGAPEEAARRAREEEAALDKATSDNLPKQPQSVGAAVNANRPALIDEADMADSTVDIIRDARDWRDTERWNEAQQRDLGSWSGKIVEALDRVGLAGDFAKLWKNDSAVANWLGAHIFESPTGMGGRRVTAPLRMEAYQTRVLSKLNDPYISNMDAWARDNGMATHRNMHTPTEARLAFGREVHLELNSRRSGNAPVQNTPVGRAADAVDNAGKELFDIQVGKSGEIGVAGFDKITAKEGYSPLVWRGDLMRNLINSGRASKAQIVRAIEGGYMAAGNMAPRDARVVAKAVVNRALKQADGFDLSLQSLMTSDGRDALRSTLENNGMTKLQIDRLMKRLGAGLEERGKVGWAKGRNEIDLASAFSHDPELKIVDLVENDMIMNWARHTRRASGAASLARIGITNRAQRTAVRDAIMAEQAGLGQKGLTPEYVDSLFTHFDGGPIAGGVDPWAMRVKRVTNLSLLNKLGVTQAGEFGAIIAAAGWENFLQHSLAFRNGLNALHGPNPQGMLDELKPLLGDLGMEHQHFRDDLAIDETRMSRADRSEFEALIDGALARGQRLQGFISGFYHIRMAQQRLAVTTMTDRSLQWIKAGPTDAQLRRLGDIGLDREAIAYLKSKIDDGTVEFRDGYVNRLNLDRWDWQQAERYSMSLNRHQHQVVQKVLAGEDSIWMHQTVGSLLTHLKSFPLLAIQKQAVRNARIADPAALAGLFMGLGTAGLAHIVKQLVDGRTDRLSPQDVMTGAFSMSNITGFVPMVTDPIATMFGLENMRFNQYGPHTEAGIPSLDVANKLMRAPGAAFDIATGNANGYDWQAVRAIPFVTSYGLSAIVDGR